VLAFLSEVRAALIEAVITAVGVLRSGTVGGQTATAGVRAAEIAVGI